MFRLLLVCVTALFGCAANVAPIDDQSSVAIDEGIAHGADDRERHPAVVAIHTLGGRLCSGALVAPTVVLTAHHCVTESVEKKLECPTDRPQLGSDLPPMQLAIGVGDGGDEIVSFGRAIHAPKSRVLCEADIAVVVLGTPIIGIRPLALEREATTTVGDRVVTVGFGRASDGKHDSGARRFRSDVPITDVTRSELWIGEATCAGDSGGPAIDQETGRIVGIMSRGSACPTANAYNVYTRISAFRALIDPLVDRSFETSLPEVGDLGDACSSSKSCASGICVDHEYCSRSCDAGRCPAGFRCTKSGKKSVCTRAS